MTAKTKLRIHKINHQLNKPVSIIVVLILLFAYFAYDGARADRQRNILIQNTNSTVAQLKRVLCEEIPDNQCNLSKAVAEINANNTAQTVLLCKLFLSGGRAQLSDDDTSKIEAICKEQIKRLGSVDGVTSSNTTGSLLPGGSQKSSNTSPSNTEPSTSTSQGDNNHNAQPTPLLCINNTMPTLDPITGKQLCL